MLPTSTRGNRCLSLHPDRRCCHCSRRAKIDCRSLTPGLPSTGCTRLVSKVRRQAQAESTSEGAALGVIKVDPQLKDHEGHLMYRWQKYQETLDNITQHGGGLVEFSKGYKNFGICREDGYTVYREWAPGAVAAQMIGDFNNWSGTWMERDSYGVWTCKIPDNVDGSSGVPHRSRVKIRLQHQDGWWTDVLPAWTKYAKPGDDGKSIYYDALHWDPPPHERYIWRHERPQTFGSLRIYEAHVGISSIEPKVASYSEFADNVIPRIAQQGYNAIQLMAVQEHVYYASFGYHVTSPFAVSSRCGNPEDLKRLIDIAHSFGMLVFLDVVHSHFSKNVADGLAGFDMGQSEDMNYFYGGEKGYHQLWDSRLPNYRNWEVLRYLLSNLSWWIDEYRFDGFRFDGVTSMLYHHHGINFSFSGNYDEYFSTATDVDAVVYLMLANKLVHDILPQAVTISEDVSGMAGMCRPVHEGGIGFDYRLGMGLPDKWFEILDTTKDEDWSMQSIVAFLGNRRTTEKTVAYVESHDQCLVGGQSFAFKLMGAEMYDNMSSLQTPTPVIERGISLHKVVRLITMALGGDAWLNFIGNEFGHPEWLDFPREGNDWSHDKSRRRWDLADSPHLRYQFLNAWDDAMMHLEEAHGFMRSPHRQVTHISEEQQLIVVERGMMVFVFNLSPSDSYEGLKVAVSNPGRYRIFLDSDATRFGGHGRLGHDVDHFTTPRPDISEGELPHTMQVLSPSRTAVVYLPVH